MKLSSSFVALVGFAVSATARVQIQSLNDAFNNAGIQGCIAVAQNTAGSPLIIHNCNTESDLALQDWEVSFFTRQPAGPQQIKAFGDKCIDVKGGVAKDGAKLQISNCADNVATQKWISVNDFTFKIADTNFCIDLTDGSIKDGNVLQIWTCANNNANQKWGGAPNPDTVDVVHLTGGSSSAANGPYCIAAASNTNGAQVALVNCLNADFHTTFPDGNITWSIPVAPLTGKMTTFGNKCLDVPNGSTANGVKLQIWDCAEGNTNQMWTIHSGFDQIEWAGKGKCLDLTDGKTANGNPIQLWDCVADNGSANQKWFRGGV
ncbi:ricin B lectin domain-containing protein [Favolaschia claudopus]|uniref:Ricin B lectin domain-containing protein n=1 Tax=Favolaschia claudopus TaxID=2862362 RepID=A0AAW0DVQ7_9AGAR